MEEGTRFRVVRTDTADMDVGIAIGDTGTVVCTAGNLVGCRMNKCDVHRHDLCGRVESGRGRWLERDQIEPIHSKPRRSPGTTDTSSKALASQKDKAPGDCAQILACLERRPCGSTCDHLEQALGMSHQTASARIRDLARQGKIADSGRREKTRTGRPAICWKAVDTAET